LRVRIDADSVRNEEIDCHLGTIAGPALRPVSRGPAPRSSTIGWRGVRAGS
jgi:hypothetical protein